MSKSTHGLKRKASLIILSPVMKEGALKKVQAKATGIKVATVFKTLWLKAFLSIFKAATALFLRGFKRLPTI